MPPKIKFTKEQIVDASIEIVREKGMDALSARALARALGCSPQPIFSYFENMEQVKEAVIKFAKALYAEYIEEGLKETLPFKGVGMQYIQFAKDEPELFTLLFMSGTDTEGMTHFLPSFDDNSPAVLLSLKNFWGLTEDNAKKIYNHLSVYTHGFAVLFARKACIFTMEDISCMLTEVFTALLNNMKRGESL
ncbi:MAG: TetR/AcrR family transcriptional regulator [Acutalibacteraceae bacterium]